MGLIALVAALAPSAPASAVVTCPTVVAGVVTPAPSAGIDWTGCLLVGADLHGADFSNAVLTGANLTGADLHGANLAHAVLHATVATSANLTGAALTGADLTQSTLLSARINAVNLTGAVLDRVRATSASFDGAVLTSASGAGASFVNASFVGTTVTGASLGTSILTGVRGSGLVVGATAPTLPLGYGVRAGVLVGPDATMPAVDLHGQDLSGLSLARAHLTAANLAGANLTGVTLSRATLASVNLAGADLSAATLASVHARGITGTPVLPAGWSVTRGYLVGPSADLSDAQLIGVDLSGRDLSGVVLSRARLVSVDLTSANLTSAVLDSAVVTDSTITGSVLGLQGVHLLRTAALVGTPASLTLGLRVVRGVLIGPDVLVSKADFHDAALAGIDLTGASIQGGTWAGADLTGAHLASTQVQQVDLSGAHLRSVDLTGAYVSYVTFSDADLRGAKLTGAGLEQVALYNADLLGATGFGTGPVTLIGYGGTRCPNGTMSEQHVHDDCLAARDLVAPTVHIGQWPAYQTSTTSGGRGVPLHATATDAGSDVVSMQERERQSVAGRTTWGAWSDPYFVDASSGVFYAGGYNDRRTCVQVRAQDLAGNWSAWSAQRCSTWMADDIDLFWSSLWHRHDRSGWFNDTYARTSSYGAWMRSDGARTVGRLGVAGLGCPTCGSVTLYVGSTRVRTISLARPTTGRVVVILPAFRAVRGVVRLVVTTRGKPVVIDGVLIASS
jgi:uncharacterized protein YjbI with pentapeptide repeats